MIRTLRTLAALLVALSVAQGQPSAQLDVPRFSREQNERIRQHAHDLPPQNTAWYEVLDGTSKVLISAPHATAQSREGRLKDPDEGTGALAMVLNKLARTPVIYTTWASPSDPNFYDSNAYKEELERQIRLRKPLLVLDLHASNASRPYDMDFGTMHGKSLSGHENYLVLLRKRLQDAGIQNLSDNFFPAEKNATVTKFSNGHKVSSIQLEINASFLRPERGGEYEQRYLRLVGVLVAFVKDMDALK
jgi:hypothetical protein